MIKDCGYTVGDNTWRQYSFSFNSGNNSKVRLYLGDGGGTHYFDDFDLIRDTVQNKGFETESITPWFGNTSIFTVTTADKHSGTYGLKLLGTGSWGNLQQDMNVLPNTDYTWTFWAKSSSTGARFELLTTSNGLIKDCGRSVGDNTWRQYSFNFNSGDNLKVRLYIGDGGAGTFYFDDFEAK